MSLRSRGTEEREQPVVEEGVERADAARSLGILHARAVPAKTVKGRCTAAGLGTLRAPSPTPQRPGSR